MDELASKLFKTFFRSKKYFLRKKLQLVKVTSKTEISEISQDFLLCLSVKGDMVFKSCLATKKNRKNCVHTFVHSCSTYQTYYFDLIISVDMFQQVSNVQF